MAPCEFDAPLAMRVHAPIHAPIHAPNHAPNHLPESGGEFPVVVFQHGFMARNVYYDGILRHLASHGFVVVAPQMYELGIAPLLGRPPAAVEAELSALVLGWIPGHLGEVAGVSVSSQRIGLAGHSRGGKVAWLVAATDPARIGAIAGADAVDGEGGPWGNQRRVVQGPFPFSIPALVIGAELGGLCAPRADNHERFYEASHPPAWQVFAPGQGHGDMLDEPYASVSTEFCASRADRAGMRRLTAGLLVALFRGALQGDVSAYQFLSSEGGAPIAIIVNSR